MIGVKDKIWFLREGLFAKYVVSLVGLVVFVLAVNGLTETWISYRATKTTLTDAMSEKADATAKRIEQSVSELERQISWVTRASAVTLEQRRDDYAQLLNQVAPVSQLVQLNGQGREFAAVAHRDLGRQRRGLFARPALHRDRGPRRQLLAGLFLRLAAVHVDRGGAFRLQCRRHRRRDRLALPLRLPRRRPGRQGELCLCGRPAARCWRAPRRAPISPRTSPPCPRSPR